MIRTRRPNRTNSFVKSWERTWGLFDESLPILNTIALAENSTTCSHCTLHHRSLGSRNILLWVNHTCLRNPNKVIFRVELGCCVVLFGFLPLQNPFSKARRSPFELRYTRPLHPTTITVRVRDVHA